MFSLILQGHTIITSPAFPGPDCFPVSLWTGGPADSVANEWDPL